MEQFLTGDIWSDVNKLLIGKQQKTACIAYVTSNNLNLINGDILVCDASTYSIKNGNTSAKVIEKYFNLRVKIYTNQNLHSKLLLTDQFLVIGSSNLSSNSATNLIESAVVTDSAMLVSQSKAFCHNLILESIQLTRELVNDLLKIEVIKRDFKPTSKSKLRDETFGKDCWIMPVTDLSEKIYKTIKSKVEKSIKVISEKEQINEDEVSFLRLRGISKFTTDAKIGDQIILNWESKEKKRRNIHPPATILRIEKDEKITLVYYDNKKEDQHISWSKFRSFSKGLELDLKTDKPRKKKLLETDLEKLKPLWK